MLLPPHPLPGPARERDVHGSEEHLDTSDTTLEFGVLDDPFDIVFGPDWSVVDD